MPATEEALAGPGAGSAMAVGMELAPPVAGLIGRRELFVRRGKRMYVTDWETPYEWRKAP